jgi:uncharacterized protein YcaQ
MKNKTHILSPEQARMLALQNQGLLKHSFGKGKKAVLAAIQHLGYVQIDTLAVVERAHHHSLWSRLPDYNEKYLNELLENDKAIFEYWSHAASYLPMSDYRFSLLRKEAYSKGKSHWFGQDKKMKTYVLDKIKAEGPLQSKDFEHKRTGPGNWYEWKPAKRALEQLFMEGKLMVAKRKGFQKVYDLAERVLPAGTDTSTPTINEHAEYLIRKAIQSHGVINETEITYLRNDLKEPVNKVLKRLLKEGQLLKAMMSGSEKTIFITTPEQLKTTDKAESKNIIHILSPFDNLLIQRKRVQRIFNFDYMIECYLPEAKRKYGYFTLPVLYNDGFIARFDPKADRTSKTFYIRSMHFEKSFKPTEKFNAFFASRLKDFATFNDCTRIVIEKAEVKWKKEVMELLKD